MASALSTVDVDVLALEDFAARLDGRVAQADALLRHLDGLMCRNVPLGDLPDADEEVSRYYRLCLRYRDGVRRLRDAVVAARSATGTILENYTSAEERTAANAAAIAGHLAGVRSAWGGH